MPGKLRHMVLLLLVFSLLTGSVGVAATQRFCAMLGGSSQAEAAKMQKMGCCAKKQKPACPEAAAKVGKKECCSLSTTHHKLDIQSSLKFNKLEWVPQLPQLLSSFLLPTLQPLLLSAAWPLYSDSSPPIAGRQLLHRLHTLVI